MRRIGELVRDDRGVAVANLLSSALVFGLVFGTFILNVLYGQICHRKDCVTHSCSIGADAAKKTYCAQGESSAAAEAAARKAYAPVMATAGGEQLCEIHVIPSGESGSDPGAQDLEVTLECQYDCSVVPWACQQIKRTGFTFKAKEKTTAIGCDGEATSS